MQNNTLPLCTLHQSKRLKELGFGWETTHYFDNRSGAECRSAVLDDYNSIDDPEENEEYCSRPSQALALMWLRELKGVHGWVETLFSGYKPYYRRPDNLHSSPTHTHTTYGAHSEAESKLLDEILKIVTP